MRVLLLLTALIASLLVAAPASAQFATPDPGGSALGKANTSHWKMGFTITASAGPCMGIVATIPVPIDWPEQQVQIVKEDTSPSVEKIDYRKLGDGVKQMVVEIPRLGTGQKARAMVTFRVIRHDQSPPEDTGSYTIPKKVDKDLTQYLAPSPYIESKNAKITALAKELTTDKEKAWDKVDAIYSGVKARVTYKNGPLKGALKALADGDGDCEEMTSLFIALCRASGIPARTVWVPGHCYPEFYLLDAEGKGHWFPSNVAADGHFVGGIVDPRPVLQKGDNFKDPARPKEKLHYVSEYLTAESVKGSSGPRVEWVMEEVKGD